MTNTKLGHRVPSFLLGSKGEIGERRKMPRKKIIDEDGIKWKNIDEAIIERKNCLGVKLVFNTPPSQRQWHTMRTYFRINTDEAGQTANRQINNSWKGLVMLLLSLIYCKYGKNTLATLYRSYGSAGKKYKSHLSFSWDYDVFMDDNERTRLQKESYSSVCSGEFGIDGLFDKQVRERMKQEIRKHQELIFRSFLMELPPNPTFEQIAAPPSWKPCYVKGHYTPIDIEGNIMVFAALLDLDIKRSIITTEYCGEVPHRYETKPARYKDTSGLLCSCPSEYRFTYGIEIVEHEKFCSELENKYVTAVNTNIPPQQINIGKIPIYGYNITASTIGQLCTYFPFMESEFYNSLKAIVGNAWVIFDSKYLGKWG